MVQILTLDAPEIVREKLRNNGAKDNWMIFDASEFADLANKYVSEKRRSAARTKWTGGGGWQQELEYCRYGNNAAVEKSEKLLAEMREYLPHAARRGYIDDVAGAVPNVPAFISGNPMNMRRRISVRDEYAPLCVVYDPTSSSGISAKDMYRRGLTVLALVLALASQRPIEFWLCVGLGNYGSHVGNRLLCRVETAPIDLARAAHYITSPVITRTMGYGILTGGPFKSGGHWPYSSYNTSLDPECFTEACRQALPHARDILAIPGIVVSDALLANPRIWLDKKMRELTTVIDSAA